MSAVTAFFYGRFSYVFAACSIPVMCTILFCDDAVYLLYVSVDKHPMGDPDGDAPMVSDRFQRNPDGALYSFQKTPMGLLFQFEKTPMGLYISKEPRRGHFKETPMGLLFQIKRPRWG